ADRGGLQQQPRSFGQQVESANASRYRRDIALRSASSTPRSLAGPRRGFVDRDEHPVDIAADSERLDQQPRWYDAVAAEQATRDLLANTRAHHGRELRPERRAGGRFYESGKRTSGCVTRAGAEQLTGGSIRAEDCSVPVDHVQG